jgi:hypothetical protein
MSTAVVQPEPELPLWRGLKRAFTPPGSDLDDAGRRVFVALCAVIGVPTLVGFMALDVWQRLYVDAAMELAAALVLGVIVLDLRRAASPLAAYRVMAAMLTGLFVYLVATGSDSAALLWLFMFPPGVYFLLGTREGAAWNACLVVLAGTTAAIVSLTTGQYSVDVVLRLFVSLALISILAHGLESLRARAHAILARRNSELAGALAEVRTLSGLLPICANCKKIRDDEGYWRGVEEYIAHRTRAQFTHSICPSCAEKLYGVHLDPDGGPKGPPPAVEE